MRCANRIIGSDVVQALGQAQRSPVALAFHEAGHLGLRRL